MSFERTCIWLKCVSGLFLKISFCFVLLMNGAVAETVTGSASVEILQPVLVSEVTPLNFGFISASNADTITLNADGSVSSLNGANITGTLTPGRFSAVGLANSNVSISFAAGTLSGTGDDMAVDNFTHNLGANPSFDSTGNLLFNVGADLEINDGQTPGAYSGTYQISINYQ